MSHSLRGETVEKLHSKMQACQRSNKLNTNSFKVLILHDSVWQNIPRVTRLES